MTTALASKIEKLSLADGDLLIVHLERPSVQREQKMVETFADALAELGLETKVRLVVVPAGTKIEVQHAGPKTMSDRISETLDAIEWPSYIVGRRFELRADSCGEPAVWITLVTRGAQRSLYTPRALEQVVTSAIFRIDGPYPFVYFQTEAQEARDELKRNRRNYR